MFRTIFLVIFLFFSLNLEARVKSIQETASVPENENERGLWDVARGHQDNVAEDDRMHRDEAVEAYLKRIAHRMLGDAIDHTGIQIDFFIVKNPQLSAWVYPYGTIAVNSGLIAGMENEAQLAAIVGHELSHFLQRHSYRELISEKRQGAIGKGLGLLLTAAAASKTGSVTPDFMKAGGLWTDLVTSGYSRKNEHIADAEGLDLMRKAGYQRHEAIAAFEALKENDQYGAVNVRHLWSSHPKLDDRIENLTKAVSKEKKSKKYVPGNPVESADYYREVASILFLNARLDIEEQLYARSRRSLEKYLQAKPEDPRAYYLLGETYRRESPGGPSFEQRLAAYEKAISLDADYALPAKELGMAYRQMGHVDKASQYLAKYVGLRPDAVDAAIVEWYIQNP